MIRAERNYLFFVDLNIFSVYYSLGSGSDMATFYQRAGVPSIDMWFTYDEVSSEWGEGWGLHAQWWLYTDNFESIRYFELINKINFVIFYIDRYYLNKTRNRSFNYSLLTKQLYFGDFCVDGEHLYLL